MHRRAGLLARRVVIVVARRLQQVIRDLGQALELGPCDDGRRDEEHEHDQQDEVQDSIAHDAALAEAGLLEGVDRRADLPAAMC